MSDSAAVVRLSLFRSDLARSLARRGKRLLEDPKLRQEFPKLDPLQAYYIVKEVGVEDGVTLLRAATPEQWQTFVDLDCWSNDLPDVDDIDAWLAGFAAAGPAQLATAFGHLDEELQTIFFANTYTIYDTRSEEAPDQVKGVRHMTTPDGLFVVETPEDTQREVDAFFLLNALYQKDLHETFRLLTAAKWELRSELEEQAFRFRAGRLEDLGFVRPQVAMEIFAKPPSQPPHAKPSSLSEETALPAIYAQSLENETLLTQVLARVTDRETLSQFEHDLVYLVNAAVIAIGQSPRDIHQTQKTAARVRDLVALGLEGVLSPDGPLAFDAGEQAAQDGAVAIAQWGARNLFRHGYTLVKPVQEKAQALVTEPKIKAWYEDHQDMEGSRGREILAGLIARLPYLHEGTLQSRGDVEKAREFLDKLSHAVPSN